MSWDVEYTDEFETWWNTLNESQQVSVDASVRLIERYGPMLPYPHSSAVRGSRHGHMRELRIQHGGRPLRALYAFDPRRTAVLLLGGDKTGNRRWYEENVPRADAIYDKHLIDGLCKGESNGKELQGSAFEDEAVESSACGPESARDDARASFARTPRRAPAVAGRACHDAEDGAVERIPA